MFTFRKRDITQKIIEINYFDFYENYLNVLEDNTLYEKLLLKNSLNFITNDVSYKTKGIVDYIAENIEGVDLVSGHHQFCPFCSNMSKDPMTFEHLLPKAKFPAYVIYPLNLIPCCSFCNVPNKDLYTNFHPYFENPQKALEYSYIEDNCIGTININFIENKFGNFIKEYDRLNTAVFNEIDYITTEINDSLTEYSEQIAGNLGTKKRNILKYTKESWQLEFLDFLIDLDFKKRKIVKIVTRICN